MMARRHLWHNTRYNTMYNNTVRYNTIYNNTRYNTMYNNKVQYNTMQQEDTIQYNKAHFKMDD